MQRSGNGRPNVCAQNLLKCIVGEVPYSRLKGLSPEIIGSPMASGADIRREARHLIATLEPRVQVNDIIVAGNAEGEFIAVADVTSLE